MVDSAEDEYINFPDEIRAQYDILLQKLKGLKFATDEYIANAKSRFADMRESGDLDVIRQFRPVTPANCRVMMRNIAREIAGMRERYEKWRQLNTTQHMWARQVDGKIKDLELQLKRQTDQLLN